MKNRRVVLTNTTSIITKFWQQIKSETLDHLKLILHVTKMLSLIYLWVYTIGAALRKTISLEVITLKVISFAGALNKNSG